MGMMGTMDTHEPQNVGQAQGSATPPPESAASITDIRPATLDIAGQEADSLQHALATWQRQQDQQANRAWRRPGGMARPAGL